jgi:hypothetical protein
VLTEGTDEAEKNLKHDSGTFSSQSHDLVHDTIVAASASRAATISRYTNVYIETAFLCDFVNIIRDVFRPASIERRTASTGANNKDGCHEQSCSAK